MRPINEIIIHCTATQKEWGEGLTPQKQVEEVRRWHMAKGWSDVGYHYLITRDGTVVVGRPVEKTGAHTKGHNTGTIGVALFGGYEGAATDKFADNFTYKQGAALLRLIADLKKRFPDINKISGHNEYAAKACPTFKVSNWLDGSGPRTSKAQSTTVQASAIQIAAGAGAGVSALSSLSGTAQIIALCFVGVTILAATWIMRERLRKWANGDM